MQQRYKDPIHGRFLQNDPVGFSNIHNFNRYAYANNNPYKYVDPDGNNAAVAACVAGPNPACLIGGGLFIAAAYYGVKGTIEPVQRHEEVEDWESDYEDWASGNQ